MPGISNGLLGIGALAEGIKSGVDTYKDERRYQDKTARENRLLSLDAKSKGLLYDPNKAGVTEGDASGTTQYDDQGFAPSALGKVQEQTGLLTQQAAGLKAQQDIDFNKESNSSDSSLTKGARAQLAVITQTLANSPAFKKDPTSLQALDSLRAIGNGTHAQITKTLDDPAMKEVLGAVRDDSKAAAALAAITGRMDHSDQVLNVRDRQLHERIHKSVIDKIDRDPETRAKFQQLGNIQSSTTLVQKAVDEGKPITVQQMHDLQQSVLGSLGIKGGQSVGEREARIFDSFGMRGDAIVQFLTGKPQDVGKDNPLYAHVKDLARWESENVVGQIKDNLDGLSSGYGYIYDDPKNAQLKASLDQKLATIMGKAKHRQFTDSAPAGLIDNKAPAPGGAPSVIDAAKAELARRQQSKGLIK